MIESQGIQPFHYPEAAHKRRHGPHGYSDSQRYKPWLRDEFHFRCVYCLCRERWSPDGEDVFSVEHFQPSSLSPSANWRYDDLLYACCRCNAAKRDVTALLNPAQTPLEKHLVVLENGSIRGLSKEGMDLINVCQLDRDNLTEFRRGIFEVLHELGQLADESQKQILRRYFGFPSNLPRLSTLRPPGGNSRPSGIEQSSYERRRRGILPESY